MSEKQRKNWVNRVKRMMKKFTNKKQWDRM